MAKKKRRPPKKPLKKAAKGSIQKTYLIKALTGLGVLLLLVVIAGVLMHHLVSKRYKVLPMTKPRVIKAPRFEIYPKDDIPPHKPILKTKPEVLSKLPHVAIIIDDIGYDENVMLHLPMEPDEYPLINPGPGVLLTSMSPNQLINQLNEDLDAVPFVKGVNNHMGSKMTTIAPQLHQIFSILKERNLYFIDSRTTADTLCGPSAQLLHLPFAQKDVFIDHITKPDFIREQIHRLIKIAGRHGEAVGIAHPHIETYEILREMLPELKEKTILVGASHIVHIQD
jgi:polysaccharide deacetylase 2 family uncharacterized protein YibQ